MSESQAEAPVALLRRVRGLLIDLDGVIHVGPDPVGGLPSFLRLLKLHTIKPIYITNNSTLSTAALLERLSRMGIEAAPEEVMNSANATASYLAERYPDGGPVYVIGEKGLIEAIRSAGFELTSKSPIAVAVGLDREFSYAKIQLAASAILAGAEFVACNADSGHPTPAGVAPGAGSMVAAVLAACGTPPVVIGKPEPRMFLEGVRRLGIDPLECAVVGDNLEVDIACAHRAGLPGILVLSGMTDEEMLHRSKTRPELVFKDIGDMAAVWKTQLEG